ncbi:tRNA (5-methylaminomethyl-2-thiouridine)(34)-methyltransferase MnmD [uncultured Tateyamaria sp.]|uniref:tRNA (5-methylaminomethyl-2-thiouridine)(34)-methyltransferase MnmD n=1 Tax=Tateyamaria sp. 1078 TaxID=3417464 RepID=UPI00261166D8|nr:tRNA (5-methylaminomethyl-2-thiouridine)(34)-methyltransferase MnmD [uncultured Tateyamaria sp.]
MQDQSTTLGWRDGRVPVSTRFDDPYFSLDNGLDETRHVFLTGNDLPARFRDGFHVAELGFGTGLNLLATWSAWRQARVSGRLHFTSFEAFPMALSDMETAVRAFPEVETLAATLLSALRAGGPEYDLGEVMLTLITGDARTTLPDWQGMADAWFLDGFSPAKNPELWGQSLMAEVGRHTVNGGTAATYTAAGHVRRGLEAGGFAVARVPGFGRKRHMTKATRR